MKPNHKLGGTLCIRCSAVIDRTFQTDNLLCHKCQKEALEVIEYFVKRVEEGTIRSKVTYSKYKEFLKDINNE